jgi:hypothetical protein
MTYWTVAWGVALGLAGYNIVASIIDLLIEQYHAYKLNRILDDMDWYEYEPPAVKKPRKKK